MSTPPQGEPPAATQQATIPPPPPEALVHARQLAVTLGETEEKPIIQIARVIDALGPEEAKAIASKAQEVYAGDGILTKDKATGEMRKRSPGGTFFALVRQQVGEKDWRKKIKPVMKQKAGQSADPMEQFVIIREAASRQNFKAGPASKVEITLTGRPAGVQKQPTFVALSFAFKAEPALAKGLPSFESKAESKSEGKTSGKTRGGTGYLVLVANKQWEKVEAALNKDKNDKLVIKGYCIVHPSFSGIVVQAVNVNTVGLMSANKRG